MPFVRPVSDLRNKLNEISEICHKQGEPVFITKKGRENLVVMSLLGMRRSSPASPFPRNLGWQKSKVFLPKVE